MSSRHSVQDKVRLAAQLKAYRRHHNITQEQLARLLETTVFSINRWETGKHYPNATGIKIMKMLKVLQ